MYSKISPREFLYKGFWTNLGVLSHTLLYNTTTQNTLASTEVSSKNTTILRTYIQLLRSFMLTHNLN